MATLANLVVKLSANTQDFKAGMDRARGQLGTFTRGLARFAGGAVVGGVLGLSRLAQKQLEVADATSKLATRLGTSTEFLSEMAFVAERSGVKVEGLNTGLQRMQRRIAEAAAGNKGLAAALGELGLNADELKLGSLEDQFNAVAKALDGIKDPADRTRLAFKLFDTEGVALLQTLEGGFEGIAAMRAEAQKLGVTIGGDTAKNAVALNDAMTDLNAALAGIGNTLLVEVGPGLTAFIKTVTDKLPGVVQIFKSLVSIVGQATGALVAVGAQLFQGNLSGALAAGKGFGADLRQNVGGIQSGFNDAFGEAQVDEQKQTNATLKQIARKLNPLFATAAP